MTTFIARGLLNPPGGADDFLSGGVLSRHSEGSFSMELTLTPTVSAGGTSTVFENAERVDYTIDVVTEGAQTNVSIEFGFPMGVYETGGPGFPVEVEDPFLPGGLALVGYVDEATLEAALEADNSGWTVAVTFGGEEEPPYYCLITFTRGSLSGGSHELDLSAASLYAGWGEPFFGTPPDPGPHLVYADGQSNQVIAADDDAKSFTAHDIDITLSGGADTGTEDESYEFDVAVNNTTSADDNEITITIDDAVTCSEPTTTSNPDGWSVGSWTTPGGGIQWQCTLTRASSFSGSSTFSIETTPSETGTLTFSFAASNGYGFTDSVEFPLEVESGITWSVDATSGIAVPANATEWAAFLAYHGLTISAPNHLWLCQEASGNLADSIGSYTLTAQGSPAYQQTVSGWDRKGVQLTQVSTQGFMGGTGTLSPASSVAWLAFSIVTTPSGNRPLLTLSDNAAGIRATMSTTPRIGFTYESIATTNGTHSPTGAVRPFLVKQDVTSSDARLYTNQEMISPPFTASRVDGNKGLGTPTYTSAPSHTVYLCAWSGSGAEFTAGEVHALLTALGLAPSWSEHAVMLRKSGGSSGTWDGQAYTSETFSGTVEVEWVATTTTSRCTVGLSADNPDASYTGIDRALICDAGTLYKSENGSLTSLGAYAAGDTFKVERVTGTNAVTYYKNGVSVGSGTSLSGSLLVDTSFRFTGDLASTVTVYDAGSAVAVTWNATNVTVGY